MIRDKIVITNKRLLKKYSLMVIGKVEGMFYSFLLIFFIEKHCS